VYSNLGPAVGGAAPQVAPRATMERLFSFAAHLGTQIGPAAVVCERRLSVLARSLAVFERRRNLNAIGQRQKSGTRLGKGAQISSFGCLFV